jgi:hypothetical protein
MERFVIILIIITLFCLFYKENFDIVSSNQYNEYEGTYKSDKDTTKPKPIKCCLVEKKYLPPGKFKYEYNYFTDNRCDPKLYNLDSNKQLMIEGENDWTNEKCMENSLGSCRWINKECIDFVDKKFCDKYKMTWSKESCHNPLEFVWKDTMNRIPPKQRGNGKVKMF